MRRKSNPRPEPEFQNSSDMRKAKRVRFTDSEVDGGVTECGTSRVRRVNHSPKSDAPKTSEYAYFRKLKSGAANSHVRSSLHNENKELKSSKANSLNGRETNNDSEMLMPRTGFSFSVRSSLHKELTSSKETKNDSEMLKPRTGFTFSVSGETERPSDHRQFFLPHVSEHEEPEQLRNLTNKTRKRSPSLPLNLTPVGQKAYSSPLDEAPANSGSQHIEKGIFSAKRHKLRQWVAQTSFPGVDKLHPKGFDLVSSLLSRLFPKGSGDGVCLSNFYDSSNGDTDYISKSLAQSSYLENRLHVSHTPHWDNDLLKLSSDGFREIVLPERDNFVTKLPFQRYATEPHFQDELMKHDERSRGRISRNSHSQHDFSFCIPFERYRYSGSGQLKELDEFCSPIQQGGKEPNRFLLEWDYKNGQDISESSVINHKTSSFGPRLANSWNIEHPQIVDNELDFKRLFSVNLVPNCHLEFDAMPHSASYLTKGFGTCFEDAKCDVAEQEQEQLSLALPYPSACITLAKDRNVQNILYADDSVVSYRDLHGNHMFWDTEPENDFRRKCLSSAHFSAEDISESAIINHETSIFRPRLANSLNVDRLQTVDNEPGFKRLFSPNLLSNYHLEFDAMPHSASYLTQDSGACFEDRKCAVAEQEQLALAIPYTPACITLAKDRNVQNILYPHDSVVSYRDVHSDHKFRDTEPENDFW